jgi:flavodoxin
MNKVLIVYYSHSGVTRTLAEKINKVVSGDIYEVKPVEPYPGDVYATIKIFKDELKHKLRRPIEEPDIISSDYDTIFIGTPNWGATVATPLLDFFSSVDIQDKRIIPFVTHGGGGVGNCAKDIMTLAGSDQKNIPLVLNGGGVSRLSENDIRSWLKDLER